MNPRLGLLLALLSCDGETKSPGEPAVSDTATDTAAATDTATATGDTAAPEATHTISMVATTSIPGLTGVRGSVVEVVHGNTYVFGTTGTTIRMLSPLWVHPSGSYCTGGNFDEDGVCRGGEVWLSGRIDSPQPTRNFCIDREQQVLHLIKEGGEQIEVVDVGMQGEDAYSYLRVVRRQSMPAPLAVSGSYTGPCTVLPEAGGLVVSSPEQQAIAVLEEGESFAVSRKSLLPFRAGSLDVYGQHLVLTESEGNRLSVLNAETFAPIQSHVFNRPIGSVAVDRESGVVWLVVGASRVERVVIGDPSQRNGFDLGGHVAHLVVDAQRGLAWAAVEGDEGWRLVLISSGGVLADTSIDGSLLGLAEPAMSGDVPVYMAGPSGESVSVRVFAAAEIEPTSPALHGFLFTTIEEPSDLNMDQPCLGEDSSFERELALVRNNAEALASLDVPVALAISDNFTQKAKECGETAIFRELADHGFSLGVLIHNRPCYHCTDGSHESNPDSCLRNSPHWIRAASTSACFPDDPEYCPLGDWACYRDHVSPRIDLVDRNIPGGGAFIAGADRHRMWDFDWVRLYREVERSTVERNGFDLTMFANTWAYADIGANDPRGKNMAPWSLADQTRPWWVGDVEHWTADAPLSDLLYLPGNSTSTIKMAEYTSSGLFMIDFFSADIPLAYQTNDFDVAWQVLRTAMNHRQQGVVNTWYFHVHDLGLINLRDKNGNLLHYDPDGEEGPLEAIPNERMLQDFIDRIDETYAASGQFVWAEPQAIRTLISP